MRLGLGLGLSKNNFIPSGGGPSFILDTVTALNGYSLRKLKSTATKAIRVRRSSDNAEQDIGFVGEDLDEASLLGFVGANDGFVVTWYDQVGNIDYNQLTALNQPVIVTGGVMEIDNNKAIIDFDGSITNKNLASTINLGQNILYSTIINQTEARFDRYLDSPDSSLNYFRSFASANRWQVSADGSITSANDTLVPGKLTSINVFVNGESSYLNVDGQEFPGTLNVSNFSNQRLGANSRMRISEHIILLSDSDKEALKTNQNSYYAIA